MEAEKKMFRRMAIELWFTRGAYALFMIYFYVYAPAAYFAFMCVISLFIIPMVLIEPLWAFEERKYAYEHNMTALLTDAYRVPVHYITNKLVILEGKIKRVWYIRSYKMGTRNTPYKQRQIFSSTDLTYY